MLPTLDAYTPREIARKIETLGVTKARSDTLSLLVLAVLAGAFIALGALFFTVVMTRSALGFGVSRLVGGVAQFSDGAVRETALAIGRHKAALGVTEALALGVLCNGLVCLAVWLAMGGRSVADKVLAIVFPITAFVRMGFEHWSANLFFLPYGLALRGFGDTHLVAGSVRNIFVVP